MNPIERLRELAENIKNFTPYNSRDAHLLDWADDVVKIATELAARMEIELADHYDDIQEINRLNDENERLSTELETQIANGAKSQQEWTEENFKLTKAIAARDDLLERAANNIELHDRGMASALRSNFDQLKKEESNGV